MRNLGKWVLIAVLAASAGCTSVPARFENSPFLVKLTPAGEKVTIVDFLPTEERSKYSEVAMVRCGLGANEQDRETNTKSCLNNLRNQAARMGGRYVMMDTNDIKRVPHCSNCIEMKGVVLSLSAE